MLSGFLCLLCCAVLCRAVLCCVVLWHAVLCAIISSALPMWQQKNSLPSRPQQLAQAPGLSTLGRGAYFGESGVLETVELHTLVAHTPTRVLALTPEQYKRVNASCMERIEADREGKASWYCQRVKDIETSKKALTRHHHHHHRRHYQQQQQQRQQPALATVWAANRGEGAKTTSGNSLTASPPTRPRTEATRRHPNAGIFKGQSPLALARTHREIMAIQEGTGLAGSFDAANLTRRRREEDGDSGEEDDDTETTPETPRTRPEEGGEAAEMEQGPLSPERLIKEAIHEIARMSNELEMWKSPRSAAAQEHSQASLGDSGTLSSAQRKKRAAEKRAARANEPKRKAQAAERARARAAARKVRRALKRVRAFSLLEYSVQSGGRRGREKEEEEEEEQEEEEREEEEQEEEEQEEVEQEERCEGRDEGDGGRGYGIMYSPRLPKARIVDGHGGGFANFR